MKIKKTDLLSLSSKEIFKNYSLMINKIYKDYMFLEIGKNGIFVSDMHFS